MTLRFQLRAVAGFSLGLLLAGCGQQTPAVKTAVASKGVSGGVHGGQNPVTGATIQLWQVNTTADGGLGTAMLTHTVTSSDGTGTTNSNANTGNAFNTLPAGDFTITGAYSCPAPGTLVYITASGGNPGLIAGTNNPQSQMVTALGTCNNLKTNVQFIEISEQTTVATVASLYAFMSAYNAIGASPAHAADIAFAFSQVNQYIDFQAGTAPGPALPANYSASTADLNLEANVLASCVNSTGGTYNDGSPCGTLFIAASPAYTGASTASTDVTAAALFIRKYYTSTAGQVATLASPQAPFQPASATAPPDWTLPIFQLPSAPTFSLSSGTYSGAQQVFIQDSNPDTAIYYTTGVNPPTINNTPYRGAVTVSKNETISAIAIARGRANSAIGSASYTITGVPANAPIVAITAPTLTVSSTTPFTIQATSSANGSQVSFSVSDSVGGTISPATCTVASGYCNVTYTPSGALSPGTYSNGVTANFSASSGYLAATATGTVYVIAAATVTPLVNNGAESSLIQASDGNFYGLDQDEGPAFVGRLFKMNSSGNVTTLYGFTDGPDGAFPEDHLVQGTDGYLYGVTFRTHYGGNGTIFKIDTSGNFTLLYSFTGSLDGARPSRSLVQGTDGSFYGTASQGGAYGFGTLFKIDPSGNFTVLHAFAEGVDGAFPMGSLIQGADGHFYGTTGGGGTYGLGSIFKMDASGNVTNLYSFTGGADGSEPYEGLVQATDGGFYGSTLLAGALNGGTLFKIDSSNNFSTLHTFAGPDGDSPESALIQGSDGALYGTAFLYGPATYGTVYKIDTSGNFTLLYGFANDGAGDGPIDTLLQGADGSFYGATSDTFFKLTPSPALPGPIALTVPSSVTHGSPFTLSYTVYNASSATMQHCFATNTGGDVSGWTGIKTASTSPRNANLTAPSTTGTYTYSLTCGGIESGFATLHVQ